MECKTTCIEIRRRGAFTLLEVLIASALAVVVGGAIAAFTLFSSRTFVYMADFTDMNQSSQFALDEMSRQIRQAKELTSYSSNSLTFLDATNGNLQFSYDPSARTLVQTSGGKDITLLTDCDSLQFAVYQHTMISNTFDCYSVSATNNTRVIQVDWTCSRDVYGKKAATETVETAEIVMRNH